jgi:hypothetical protein
MAVLDPIPGTTAYLWKYIPSLQASIVFAVLFLVMSCLLGLRMYKTRTWFCSAFVAGCISKPLISRINGPANFSLLVEVIGYVGRAFCTNNTGGLGPYIIQATFILIPPAFYAATIYMSLARIIRIVGADHLSIIRPQIVTKVFVTGDILSFGVQGSASGLWVHPNLDTIATILVTTGLAIQLISFIVFFLCAVIFHRRIRRNPTELSSSVEVNWVDDLYMLYSVSALIVIRSVFRIVEYVMGQDGYPITHEWTLLCFDSVPMCLVAVIFYMRYPINLGFAAKTHVEIQLQSQGSGESRREV